MPLHTSDNLDELATALAKAQAEMQPVLKQKKAMAGKYSYSYADLAAVIETATATLAVHGLSISTPFEVDDRGEQLAVMMLMHTSGQRIVSRFAIRTVSDNPQAVGSAVSYARRYMLMSLVNLPATDDDGQAAMPRNDDHVSQSRRSPQWDPQQVPESLRGPRQAPPRGRGRPPRQPTPEPKPTSELYQDVMERIREAGSQSDLEEAWHLADGLTDNEEHADMKAAWVHRRDAIKSAAQRSAADRDSIKASLTLPKPA